ncbi:hypothetical protein D0T50_09805 [Bacteroides sp. 214]|uniref:hypothetical protein n=1 Tax=Bacteroides sp. 214 TaxID=2302935 RepID=UPI0013D3D3B3|nr:hypothetical protein [Bacteroides sp. 214]NDW13188.1 hypothetical protein [Bacteroides sp. 214]
MKVDLYTKAVLTIIAIALVCLVYQNSNVVPAAYASQPAATNSYVDVNIIGWGKYHFNRIEDYPLPVVLK